MFRGTLRVRTGPHPEDSRALHRRWRAGDRDEYVWRQRGAAGAVRAGGSRRGNQSGRRARSRKRRRAGRSVYVAGSVGPLGISAEEAAARGHRSGTMFSGTNRRAPGSRSGHYFLRDLHGFRRDRDRVPRKKRAERHSGNLFFRRARQMRGLRLACRSRTRLASLREHRREGGRSELPERPGWQLQLLQRLASAELAGGLSDRRPAAISRRQYIYPIAPRRFRADSARNGGGRSALDRRMLRNDARSYRGTLVVPTIADVQ